MDTILEAWELHILFQIEKKEKQMRSVSRQNSKAMENTKQFTQRQKEEWNETNSRREGENRHKGRQLHLKFNNSLFIQRCPIRRSSKQFVASLCFYTKKPQTNHLFQISPNIQLLCDVCFKAHLLLTITQKLGTLYEGTGGRFGVTMFPIFQLCFFIKNT